MASKKDVEHMNHFELMNEVERLRKFDEISELRTQIGQLKHDLSSARAQITKLEKSLEFIKSKGRKLDVRITDDRRRQTQGRRQPTSRRKKP